jgi:hypothetical protein
MHMNDEEAAAYYEDDEHQEPAGPGRHRSRRGLSTYVPIRFRPEVISRVRILASRDGKTVSSWIRDLVEHEIKRRLPAPHSKGTQVEHIRWLPRVSGGTTTTATETPERALNFDVLSA